eukprot:EG_transcript_6945
MSGNSSLDTVGPVSENGSMVSDFAEVYELGETQGIEFKTKQRSKKRDAEEKSKSLVDPRKYKTKLCRNWKATGTCPYEHTCCYAHGELETRTMHQNNNVLSSLGYFSGIMLLAMKDDKQRVKGPRQGKKPQQPKQPEPQPPKQPEAAALSMPVDPTTPKVHSPYCLPDAAGFGSESGPGSPLAFTDSQMPSFSDRVPRSPAFAPMYAPYPEPLVPYDVPEYCVPATYSYHSPNPLAAPLGYPPMYHHPSFQEHLGYEEYLFEPDYSLEAHQAALEKHPAVRNLQSGEMSQKQLQKVLHDIMYTNNKRRSRKKSQMVELAAPEQP